MSTGRGSKTSSADELPEWKEGARTARARRNLVGTQIADALKERDETGSRAVVAKRLNEFVESDRHGDVIASRAAAFELSVAVGQLVVELDLERARPR
jgi:hypothetical protein